MNILAIDTGSTSTKLGLFFENNLSKETIRHPREELNRFPKPGDQYSYRLDCIKKYLRQHDPQGLPLAAVVGRGGLLRPMEGGVYLVDAAMMRDLREESYGTHASNLSGLLAQALADQAQCPAYVVDPVVVDELSDLARISGFREIDRRSIFHALNQRATARRVAADLGRPYEQLNLIVAHMGGGISVGAHCRGRVVDVNNALNGDGPFSPERTGGLPLDGVFRLLREKRYDVQELQDLVYRKGGLYSYLGTTDVQEAESRVQAGDEGARLILDAMVYQIAKEIGSLAVVLEGSIDGIVLTGGLAHSERIISQLTRRVAFLGKIFVYAGEFELEALIEGALRVLRGQEKAKYYERSLP